jgi:hypothetical protein
MKIGGNCIMKLGVNFETRMIELESKECTYSLECCKKLKQTLIDGMTRDVIFVSSHAPYITIVIMHTDSNNVIIKTKKMGDETCTEELMTIIKYQDMVCKLFSKVYQLSA